MNNNVKEFRVKMNLTQKELAQIVGVKAAVISALERGKKNPSLNLAHDIAQALGAEIEEVFDFNY